MALNDPLSGAIGIFVAPSPKRQVQPLRYGAYFGGVMFLCVAGLLLSVYLAVSHYRVHTDEGFQSFCALSKNINCDTVSQSPFSVWWGLPVAVWGVAAYTFILILVVFSAAPKPWRLSTGNSGKAFSAEATCGFFMNSSKRNARKRPSDGCLCRDL